jgi:hypothetical protein
MKSAIGLLGACALLAAAAPAGALIVNTSNAGEVADFQEGAEVEDFDDLDGHPVQSYAAGQNVPAGSRFSTRNGNLFPTFHSGGASPNDPVGNPGTPIAIVSPAGPIVDDVVSGENVAAPVVILSDELWNGGFMEVIFPNDINKVGLWVTHGSVTMFMRDRFGSNLTDGDVEVTGTAGSFIGIERPTADVSVAALIVQGGDAYTFDDFTYAPEAPAPLGAAAGLLVLGLAGRFRAKRA